MVFSPSWYIIIYYLDLLERESPPPTLPPLSLWGKGRKQYISWAVCWRQYRAVVVPPYIYSGNTSMCFFIPFCLLKKTWLFIHNELCYTVLQKWKPAVPSVSVTGSIQFYVVVNICKSGTNVTTPPVEKIPTANICIVNNSYVSSIIFYVYPCVRHPCNSISQNE